jgi:dTDP-4-dehydrorhamnose reductase
MTRILLTGGSGMLGRYVNADLERTDYEIQTVERDKFDLSEPSSIYSYVLNKSPDVILHLAAETNVDLCEREPLRAGVRNHIATEMIAKAAYKSGAMIVYISTSNVFGKSGGFEFSELDMPAPLNYYGLSKYHGEQSIRSICPNHHLIVRAGWMIGGGTQYDHKFVGKVIKQLNEGSNKIKAVGDKYGSITSAPLLSNFIIWAIKNKPSGTIHFASEGTISRCDIARVICGIIKPGADVISVNSSEFPLSAPRPFSEGLVSLYLSVLNGAPTPNNWKHDLGVYVASF